MTSSMLRPCHRILVVEDSATQAARLKIILEHGGCTVDLASTGHEALEKMESDPPDAVVTDLQMPEMNGLELITRMREQFSLIPAILITEHGSENLAVDALGSGAAGYVQKSDCDTLLVDVVSLAAELSGANIDSLILKGSLENRNLAFTIDSRCERIVPMACLIMRQLTAIGVLHSIDRIRFCMAIEHLLFQAVYHGNLQQPFESGPLSRADAIETINEQSSDEQFRKRLGRLVNCDLYVESEQIRLNVEHEGPTRMVPAKLALPGTPDSFEERSGMLLLTSVADHVGFDASASSAMVTKSL